MVKQMRGVPSVIQVRLVEAVGDPIIYQRINEFLQPLHAQHISSLQTRSPPPPSVSVDAAMNITQLYLSVDAATKDSLKAIDRVPLCLYGRNQSRKLLVYGKLILGNAHTLNVICHHVARDMGCFTILSCDVLHLARCGWCQSERVLRFDVARFPSISFSRPQVHRSGAPAA